MSKIAQIQTLLRVNPDEIWGPKSKGALNAEILKTRDGNPVLASLQKVLGVEETGLWNVLSQEALNKVLDETPKWFHCDASSFADPADVRAFDNCKTTGKSDLACFAIGDNGIGQFGKITAQDHTPMIAVNKETMIARWGGVLASAHRPVEVEINGHVFKATVEDRISAPGRIDLNPACAKVAGLQPPFVAFCNWRWL